MQTHVPVTLGTPFEIKLDGQASATLPTFPGLGEGSGFGEAEITLSAFDASGGAPVNIVPEPSGLGLSALALLGGGLLLRWRKGLR